MYIYVYMCVSVERDTEVCTYMYRERESYIETVQKIPKLCSIKYCTLNRSFHFSIFKETHE
jgi:hypothetical protein